MNNKRGNSLKKEDFIIRWFTGESSTIESSAIDNSVYAIIKCYMNYLVYLIIEL